MAKPMIAASFAELQSLTRADGDKFAWFVTDGPEGRGFYEMDAGGVWRSTSPKRKRSEYYLATVPAGGTVDIVFKAADGSAAPFSSLPVVVPVSLFSADQEILAKVGTIGLGKVTVGARRTRGSLIGSQGPFETPAVAVTVAVLAIGE